MWFKLGTKITSTSGGVMTSSLKCGKDHELDCKYEFPLDKNLKIMYSDRINVVNALTDPKNANYSSGFNVEFKI